MITSKNRILDAAENTVLRDGAAHLTIDAVAAEAQLSKGGVLYHFPSKDDLIRAMIARLVDQFEGDVERLAAADPCLTGRKTRAMLNAIFPEGRDEHQERHERISAALVAAVANNPGLLAALKESSDRAEAAMLDDGIDPVRAMIIHMACDGIWMSGLFGMAHPAPDLRTQVLERLRRMTREVLP
jgi:AcrR family transcriptional regulator